MQVVRRKDPTIQSSLLEAFAAIMKASADAYPSVRALAGKAGVTASALYRLFPNMDGLAIAVMGQADEILYRRVMDRWSGLPVTTVRDDLLVFREEIERFRGDSGWMPRMLTGKLLGPAVICRHAEQVARLVAPLLDMLCERHGRRLMSASEQIHVVWLVGAVQFMWAQGQPHAQSFHDALNIVDAFVQSLPPRR